MSELVAPRLPPQSLEAEVSVLGSVLLDNRTLDAIIDSLTAEDFYRESHRLLFQTILELIRTGTPADTVTLYAALKSRSLLDQVGGPQALARLAEAVPTPVNAPHYAKIVHDKATLRRFISVTAELLEEAYRDVPNIDEFIDRAEGQVFAVGQKQGRNTPQTLRTLLEPTLALIETRMRDRSDVTGLRSGFRDLDQKTAGLQPSDLIILAARPSMGKTALALNIATNVALLNQATVAIFSLEMSKEQLVTRTISAHARVSSERIRTGYLGDADFDELFRAADELSQATIFIDDTPAINVMELRSKCRRIKSDHGLGLVVVDYLQLMRGPEGTHSREQEISEISRSLKALAKELSVPVIALSQLNRSLESRQNRRPILSDLRESGAIEQDADLVMFIYRDEVYNEKTEEKGVAEVIIAKQRNGPIGTVKLVFQGSFTRFDNLAE
ncbi:MAG: replicative DNA helicase [Myxococcota bacterium]|nr:replicative DNA helicase [Myxococcota bacterium]